MFKDSKKNFPSKIQIIHSVASAAIILGSFGSFLVFLQPLKGPVFKTEERLIGRTHIANNFTVNPCFLMSLSYMSFDVRIKTWNPKQTPLRPPNITHCVVHCVCWWCQIAKRHSQTWVRLKFGCCSWTTGGLMGEGWQFCNNTFFFEKF